MSTPAFPEFGIYALPGHALAPKNIFHEVRKAEEIGRSARVTAEAAQRASTDAVNRADKISKSTEAAAQTCDVLLAIGTTLSVYPAAGVVPIAQRAGARVVIVNGEPTAMDSIADVVLRGDIAEILGALVGRRDETTLKFGLRALEHPEEDVRLAALELVGFLGDADVTAVVRKKAGGSHHQNTP